MAGCLSSIVVWFFATVALFRIGCSAEFQSVAYVIGVGSLACFAANGVVWGMLRARHRRLTADYVRLYGPLPEDAKVWGTRIGGTAGRVAGGSTGYLVGGLIGAAVDAYAEREKYRNMSEPQIALLQELARQQVVRPLLMSVAMIGALLGSWILVFVVDVLRSLLGG